MSARDAYLQLDKTVQDKFEGKAGRMAFHEAAAILVLLTTHHVVTANMTAAERAIFNTKHWYPSLLPGHPLHPLRVWIEKWAGDVADHLDNISGRRLEAKFEWLDTTAIPHARGYLQQRAAEASKRYR